MKHITYSDKSVLVGDEAAETLVDYAALIARIGSADSITLAAVGSDGDEIEATFLLTQGTILMAESTTSTAVEPDNTHAVQYMRDRIYAIVSPTQVQSEAATPDAQQDYDNHD